MIVTGPLLDAARRQVERQDRRGPRGSYWAGDSVRRAVPGHWADESDGDLIRAG
jgi:hypothetical protein